VTDRVSHPYKIIVLCIHILGKKKKKKKEEEEEEEEEKKILDEMVADISQV
jgi:hypothetical protein